MQCIIKDFKVDVLPTKGVPNSRYYVPNGIGENIDEYVTDKDGHYHKVCCTEGGTSDSLRFGVAGEDDTAAEEREFLLEGHTLDIHDNTNYGIELTLTATDIVTGNRDLFMQVLNPVNNDGSLAYIDMVAGTTPSSINIDMWVQDDTGIEWGEIYMTKDSTYIANQDIDIEGLNGKGTIRLIEDPNTGVGLIGISYLNGGGVFINTVEVGDQYLQIFYQDITGGTEFFLDTAGVVTNLTGNKIWEINGVDQDDTADQILALDTNSKLVWVDKSTVSGGGGSSLRFGKAGEDATATENRTFTFEDYQILLTDTSTNTYLYMDAVDPAGARQIQLQVQNPNFPSGQFGYLSMFVGSLGYPSMSLLVTGVVGNNDGVNIDLNPGVLLLNIESSSDLRITGIDQDDSNTKLLSLDASNNVKWVDKSTISGGSGSRFGFSGEDDIANENRSFNTNGFDLQVTSDLGSTFGLFNDFFSRQFKAQVFTPNATGAYSSIDVFAYNGFPSISLYVQDDSVTFSTIYIDQAGIAILVDSGKNIRLTGATQNDSLSKLLALDGSDNLRWVDKSTISSGGSRFGVAGEDVTATQNRSFNFNDHTFSIHDISSGTLIQLDATAVDGTREIYMQTKNTVVGDERAVSFDMYADSTGEPFALISVNGLNANSNDVNAVFIPGRIQFTLDTNSDFVLQGIDQDNNTTKILSLNGSDRVRWIDKASIVSTTGQRFGFAGEDVGPASAHRFFDLGTRQLVIGRNALTTNGVLFQDSLMNAKFNDGGGFIGNCVIQPYSYYINTEETGVTYNRIEGFYDLMQITSARQGSGARGMQIYLEPASTAGSARLDISHTDGVVGGANTYGSRILMRNNGLFLQATSNPNAATYAGMQISLNGDITVDSLAGTGDAIVGTDGVGLLSRVSYSDVVSGGQVVIFDWKFDVSVGVNNPGSGNWRADSAVGASVVTLSINDITSTTGLDISALFAQVDGNWLIHIQQSNDATKFIQFTTSGTYIDHTTWWEVPVTYVQSSGFPFSNNTKCTFVFINENATSGQRFGVSGEDDSSSVSRGINMNDNDFAIYNAGQLYLEHDDGTNTNYIDLNDTYLEFLLSRPSGTLDAIWTNDVSDSEYRFDANRGGSDRSILTVNAATGIELYNATGLVTIPSLTNLSTQNRLIGQFGTSGQIGYVTLGANLSLASGVLSASTSSSGIVRVIVSTSGSITLGAVAATDYMYFVTGAHTLSMPAAAGNTNRYTIKNNHSANITVDTAGAENIEGAASLSLAPNSSIDVISNGTNWFII